MQYEQTWLVSINPTIFRDLLTSFCYFLEQKRKLKVFSDRKSVHQKEESIGLLVRLYTWKDNVNTHLGPGDVWDGLSTGTAG